MIPAIADLAVAAMHDPDAVQRACGPQSLSAMHSHVHAELSGSQWLPTGQSPAVVHAGGLRSIHLSTIRSFLTGTVSFAAICDSSDDVACEAEQPASTPQTTTNRQATSGRRRLVTAM